jgi:hypothetical protein
MYSAADCCMKLRERSHSLDLFVLLEDPLNAHLNGITPRTVCGAADSCIQVLGEKSGLGLGSLVESERTLNMCLTGNSVESYEESS